MAPTTSAAPPPLPPSIEEAYRRKCIQLKQRLNEVEETNDASRTRLVRIQRGIEKMRLERAFLLEQLAKRTSTNVEDSEGSPSPPATPNEKPLRTKRGHRKPSFLNELGDGRAGSTFIPQGPVTMSPSSDAFSHTHPEQNALPGAPVRRPPGQARSIDTNTITEGKKPRSAFELYSTMEKSNISATAQGQKEQAEGTFDINQALASSWRDLDAAGKEEWQQLFEARKAEWNREKQPEEKQPTVIASKPAPTPDADPKAEIPVAEDVEMADAGASPPEDKTTTDNEKKA